MERVEGGYGGGGGVSPARQTYVHSSRSRVHGPYLVRWFHVTLVPRYVGSTPRCMKTTLVPRNIEYRGNGEGRRAKSRDIYYVCGVRSTLKNSKVHETQVNVPRYILPRA